MRFIPLLPALALAAALPAHAAEISVGAGASCTAPTIAAALAIAAATSEIDTIRLANDQAYTDQTVFIDTPVTVIGGHTACGDSAPAARTSLVGNHVWAVVLVEGSGSGDSIGVRLERLDVSGGGVGGDVGHFGGLNVTGRSVVSVADSSFHDNVGSFGGGIAVLGQGAILTLERNVEVHDNGATVGAGILVEGGSLRVRPHGIATYANTALNGGGLALIGGGQVSVGSDIDDPLAPVDGFLIRDNSATNQGGGVFVHGTHSSLLADDTVVRNNLAFEGGGVYAGNGGYAQFARFRDGPFRHCAADLECLRISDNTAERGGAVSVRDGGIARINETIVRGNIASGGPAFWMHGDASQLRLSASVIARNDCAQAAPGCATIFTMGGSLRFEHSTFADNTGSASLIYGDGEQGAIITDIQGYSSLIAGKDRLFDFLGALPTVHYDCIMKNQGTFEAAAERSDIRPIRFQNPARGDYHLTSDNIAIDFCDGAPVASQFPDLDGTQRGLDSPQHADQLGRFDLGAYEFDRIFASGGEAKL